MTLTRQQAGAGLKNLPGWTLADGGKAIRKEWLMKDFVAAVDLIERVKGIAEAADHHPDLHLTSFRKLAVELSTHDQGGLTEKDLALAAQIEALPKSLKT